MRSKNAKALAEIAENIAFIRSYGVRVRLDHLRENRETFYAVTRALEIISEASRQLTDDLTARHPTVPWPQVRAAGNVYRHEYRYTLVEYVMLAATTWLDTLETAIQVELERIDGLP